MIDDAPTVTCKKDLTVHVIERAPQVNRARCRKVAPRATRRRVIDAGGTNSTSAASESSVADATVTVASVGSVEAAGSNVRVGQSRPTDRRVRRVGRGALWFDAPPKHPVRMQPPIH